MKNIKILFLLLVCLFITEMNAQSVSDSKKATSKKPNYRQIELVIAFYEIEHDTIIFSNKMPTKGSFSRYPILYRMTGDSVYTPIGKLGSIIEHELVRHPGAYKYFRRYQRRARVGKGLKYFGLVVSIPVFVMVNPILAVAPIVTFSAVGSMYLYHDEKWLFKAVEEYNKSPRR